MTESLDFDGLKVVFYFNDSESTEGLGSHSFVDLGVLNFKDLIVSYQGDLEA